MVIKLHGKNYLTIYFVLLSLTAMPTVLNVITTNNLTSVKHDN